MSVLSQLGPMTRCRIAELCVCCAIVVACVLLAVFAAVTRVYTITGTVVVIIYALRLWRLLPSERPQTFCTGEERLCLTSSAHAAPSSSVDTMLSAAEPYTRGVLTHATVVSVGGSVADPASERSASERVLERQRRLRMSRLRSRGPDTVYINSNDVHSAFPAASPAASVNTRVYPRPYSLSLLEPADEGGSFEVLVDEHMPAAPLSQLFSPSSASSPTYHNMWQPVSFAPRAEALTSASLEVSPATVDIMSDDGGMSFTPNQRGLSSLTPPPAFALADSPATRIFVEEPPAYTVEASSTLINHC